MMEAVIGFLTGVLASMGLGGGFVLVVWLTLFADVEQRTAQGINVLFFLPIAFVSLIMHLKNGLVNKRVVKLLAVWGVFGAAAGTLISQIIANDLLRKLFALFLLAFGLRELFAKKTGAEEQPLTR
ncbi:MAG: sulfite exporter TauE/SafE family protein [Oscillospiraceae bacterium]|nr:sulfite exporter TauE/SafE family protein [Oscillospiraceae bacterium]